MKYILALLLIGVACATASPACSKEDYTSCIKYDPRTEDDSFRETEEYLDEACDQISCALDYKKRCGYPDDLPYTMPSFKQYKKVYDAVCEHSEMRRKYLENAKCLNRETKAIGHKCQVKEKVNPTDPEYCRSVEKSLDCTSDVIRKECGKVAGEVYDAVSPVKEFFGC